MKNRYLLALVVGLILLITSMAVSLAFEMAFPTLKTEYEVPAFRPWDDPLMSLFFLHPIISGAFLTYLWFRTRKAWKSGAEFGLVFAIFMSVPMFIVNYSSFTFSLLMVGSWTLMGFLNALVAGLALEKLES